MNDRSPALRAGLTLRSQSDHSLAFLVLAVGTAAHLPTHDGLPMFPGPPAPCSKALTEAGRSLRAGVSYADHRSGLILRCTSAGDGVVTYDGSELRSLEFHGDPDRGEADRPPVTGQCAGH
jgi:hypothetical protein